ncbi:hypothetical protein UUR9_0623 [Ureaplasma urealyticum serovar 9 str. ATCC 33175]|nr:hypothetical protein UUR9_0623 [Ureaplasma urealyticum serovar 9 str. ATCC 33175]
MKNIPLTRNQKEIMKEFYSIAPTRIIFNKKERDILWNKVKTKSNDLNFEIINEKCPALYHQIQKSYDNGNKIQSAVFSECVYAQTFANMFNLTKFVNCFENSDFIPIEVIKLLNSYHLMPRYAYATNDKKRMLIQAGGNNGIDSALITVIDLVIYTIEFKEPAAKTSEIDLPKYKEDGILHITEKWIKTNSQFEIMINEQAGLNFFEVMGKNINDFSLKSIDYAVSNNYSESNKFADVICTEDENGILVMIPTNQVSEWANIVGEIRPAGRNNYNVWTPMALRIFLQDKQATISNDIVTISMHKLIERKKRGGNEEISGYKINPIFFIYTEDCKIDKNNDLVLFDIKKVRQLNPTITAKMFFNNLKYSNVKEYYNF